MEISILEQPRLTVLLTTLFMIGVYGGYVKLAIITGVCLSFIIYFYRIPYGHKVVEAKRDDGDMFYKIVNPLSNNIYSPTSGIVTNIHDNMITIVTKLSDPHVVWSPNSGVVRSVNYLKGKWYYLFRSKKFDHYERCHMIIDTSYGSIDIIQRGGLVTRRIVNWKHAGEDILQGEMYGMTKFGSILYIRLPVSATIHVKQGQYVNGGIDYIAKWTSD